MLGDGNRRRVMVSFALSQLYQGEKVGQDPFDRIPRVLHSQYESCVEEKKFPFLLRIELDSPVVKLTTKFLVVVASMRHSK
jgi:hypothetical protein